MPRLARFPSWWLAAILIAALPTLVFAAPPRAIPGEFIVKWKRDARPMARAAVLAQVRLQTVHRFSLIDAEHVRVAPGAAADQLLTQLRADPRVEYVEPNYEWSIDLTPNDQRFPEMYALRNTGQNGGTPGADIKAVQAWDLFTGDPNLLVGVIDTGIDYSHPDLSGNVWTNPGEIPGNGIDDDANGYIDDVHGYDFVNNDGDPFDDNGHGSHCSGTIAATGNNSIGVVGINWRAKIVGIKFLSAAGSGSTDGAIAAIQYAIRVGVKLTSNSWGGGAFSQALLDAINAAGAANQLFIAAAGNASQNTDVTPSYPASYNSAFIVSVAATDRNDNLASFSNFGATTVDLAAPGVDILSLQPGGGYATLSGTSMATPHVAGAAALAMGRFPAASNLQIKQLLLNAVDVKPQLAGKCLTGGRLNLFMTIAEPDSIPPGGVNNLAVVNPASNSLGLTWTATGDDGGSGRASSYEIRRSLTPITDLASFNAATLVPGSPDPRPAGSSESFEVTGLAFSTSYYFALRARDEFGNAGPVSNVATGTTLGVPDISASPGSFSASLLTGGTATRTLTLSNTAAGTLDFTIPTPDLQFTQPVIGQTVHIGKGATDPRVGPIASGHGGPDGFGYRWVDSDDAGGPSFSWVDITATGTPVALTGDDAWSAAIPLGFSFPFYGSSFSSVRVQTNGFLSFTESTGTFFDNQPLPTSGAPANLIAPFWEDQDFGTVQRAYVQSDATRLIVSWIGVPGFAQSGPQGGPYTYQAILYPTGEIVYQYLSLGAPTNSATAGIQNATKSVGLGVAFNSPSYFHNNLAVRIVPLSQWLSVAPTSGRILAGQHQDLTVSFNALGLDGGDFDGTIRVLSNDPDESPTNLPAHLTVIGAPDIALSPTSFDFGTVFVGATPTQTLTVSNPGTAPLNVTGITSTHASVTTDVTSFTLAPHAARNVVVRFAPVTPGLVNATLTISSNDPDAATRTVSVAGNGVPAPSFSVTPESFNETLATNTAVSRNLRVRNTGGSPYVFTAEALLVGASGSVVVHGDADNVNVPKGGTDVQTGPAPLRAGGPDVFGYTYKDSDEPTGPAFAWVDISAVGTRILLNGDDQNLGPFPIGFNFPYYGSTFGTFRVCSNGWVSFTSSATSFSNLALPNTASGAPENLLAAFWDDMDFRPTNARAYYYYDGTRTIVQYLVPRLGDNTNLNSFEIILYPNGVVDYQYLNMPLVTKNSATIGIQNATKNDGLQVVFNANYVKNSLAIRFLPPARFLTVTPAGGTVPAGGFTDLTVGFNAANLFGGLYPGAIRIRGNDPVLPQKDVPANLTVIGVPDIAAVPASLAFGTGFIGFPTLRQIAIVNQGTDVLHVSNITFDEPSYGVDQSTFSVPALGQALLFVSFNPTGVGGHNGTLTVHSDDPDHPSLAVPLTGNGQVAPDVRPDPTSISATVNIPGATTRTLTLHNDGGSNLDFVIGTRITAESVPVYDGEERGKEQPGPLPGVLGTGGPDAFGYTWRDSDEPGGPAFDWVDITGIGTPVSFATGDDANSAGIPIGFNFPFYGNTFSTVNVCTNGWLSFTSTLTALTNQPLPNSSTSVPENLLAGFWDDLLPGTTPPRVFRYADGTRFIVSYVGVPRFSSGGPYSFQVILYPSGRIVYQYLSMQGTRLNEATIGIQNGTRTDGLTVVSDAAYVHDNLAIEIQTVPDYLTVSPTTGTVPAGGSANVTVGFNTAGLFGGLYQGSLTISSNDPDEPSVVVPTALTAVGVADIAAVPSSLSFASTYVGLSRELTLQVRNVGSDVLNVTGATLTNPVYTLVGASFPFALGKNAARTLTVRFTPTAACNPCAGELRLASNDPDTPSLAVALTGIGLVPPEISTQPTSLRAALATTLGPTAIRTTKPLVILNTGGSDLDWSAQALSMLPMSVITGSAETAKGQAGLPGMLGSGGPDAFGYRWADSDDPQGTPFNWIDITTIGTPISLPSGDDANVAGIPIGFSFPFYGGSFDHLNVCTNGWLSFTSTLTTFGNVGLPDASGPTPENLVAPFWDDLLPGTAAPRIYTYGDATKFVVSYVDVPHFSSGGPYTFQVILYPSGTIDYQYLSMQSTRLNEATIGIQNGAKDVGLQVAFNAAYVHDNLRVRITNRPGWLTVTPASGVTPAGGRDTVWVGFDATGLADGDYDGTVRIASNDLDEPIVDVPARAHVGVVTAGFDMDPNTLNRTANGNWVTGVILPPSPITPQSIVLSSVRVQRVVPVAPGAPVGYDGGAAQLKFSRSAVLGVLPNGDHVSVEVIGRAGDVTWFSGTDDIRVLAPRLAARPAQGDPNPTEFPAEIQTPGLVTLEFEDPEGGVATSFELWYSADAGESWSPVATGITAHDYGWTVPSHPTEQGLLELVALDGAGVMGSYLTPIFHVLTGALAVDGEDAPDHLGLRFAGRNPSRTARLQLGMPGAGPATVRVFDVRGAVVHELARRDFAAGWHTLEWNGQDDAGRLVEPGMYFIQARTDRGTVNQRFVMLR